MSCFHFLAVGFLCNSRQFFPVSPFEVKLLFEISTRRQLLVFLWDFLLLIYPVQIRLSLPLAMQTYSPVFLWYFTDSFSPFLWHQPFLGSAAEGAGPRPGALPLAISGRCALPPLHTLLMSLLSFHVAAFLLTTSTPSLLMIFSSTFKTNVICYQSWISAKGSPYVI